MTKARAAAIKAISNVENRELRNELVWSLTGSRTNQVECFHKLYNVPVSDTTDKVISHMSSERIALRLGLIVEEFQEFLRDGFGVETEINFIRDGYHKDLKTAVTWAVEDGDVDVIKAAKEIADLSYVIDGFCLEAGIPLDKVLNEVQASNLTKLGEDGQPIYREDGKVLKGPYYTEADVASVIFKEV